MSIIYGMVNTNDNYMIVSLPEGLTITLYNVFMSIIVYPWHILGVDRPPSPVVRKKRKKWLVLGERRSVAIKQGLVNVPFWGLSMAMDVYVYII